ncbi:hypothetical protein [Arthrobacter sp. CJ23]|uniref:hypothetical protein n=1 Tax=Arthrobacter sp. CJ23 TaxID=2972479 RepID=UPI00215D5760|nr:hypothetical protein [Arthrobacter sp. CJ23]UVJ40128.1 hypothetical protein NVV90_02750 [Arthrobacter sp. CJ23]
MVAIAVFGYAAVDVSWISDAKDMGESPFYGTEFLQILVRNLGAALVLYSGVVTLGLTTLVGCGVLALYIGATMSLGMHSTGGSNLVNDVIWYVPFEFLGLVMAATAGFQPVVGLGSRLLNDTPVTVASFVDDVARSLGTLLLAVALIASGAAIEAILIHLKT